MSPPCPNCDREDIESASFIESFAVHEQTLDYHDAPLAGWMRCKTCDRWFTFEVCVMVEGRLWHWELVPAPMGLAPGDADALEAIRSALVSAGGWWMSVVEDRRFGSVRERAVRMSIGAAKPKFVLAKSKPLARRLDES